MSQVRPDPWRIQRCKDYESELYTVSRRVKGKVVHLEYASDGSPMLWSLESAQRALNAQPALVAGG